MNNIAQKDIVKTRLPNGIMIIGQRDSALTDMLRTGKVIDVKKEKKLMLEEMSREERIALANDIIRASMQYKKQVTEEFWNSIGSVIERRDFCLTAKIGIMNTMPFKCLDIFIRRMKKLQQIGEAIGYEVKFSKWKQSQDYSWYFKFEEDDD